MKRHWVLCVAACVWMLVDVRQTSAGEGIKGEFKAKILQRFDKNGNGQLDPDEKQAAKAEMHKHRQGAGAKRGMGKRGMGHMKARILQRFDANGNGQLDPDEKLAALA